MNILLPIETINREIDYKLIIAGYLSGKGHQIYIGQHDFLMSLIPHLSEGGLYIGKTVFTKNSTDDGKKYYFLKKNNFNIIYLHEEGAVFNGKKNLNKILKNQYNINFFDKNDNLCVWGRVQKKVELKRSKKVPIDITGHPRFDLYKQKWKDLHKLKIKNLKKTYNNFILISGNYSTANSGLGTKFVFNNDQLNKKSERTNLINTYSSSMKQLMSMIHLTGNLAVKFPNLNFIYRPHPSENHEFYKIIFKGLKNVLVKHDGPVLPWILASRFLIHDGCTTAIEAYLANIPVINYKPIYDPNYDIWLPNQIGRRVKNINGVITYIKKMNMEKNVLKSKHKNKKIYDYLFNFQNDSFKEFFKIIDSRIDHNKMNNKINSALIEIYYQKLRTKNFFYKILKPSKKIDLDYHNTKFYGLSKTYIDEKFKIISNLLNKKISHKFHNSHLISIFDD